MIFMFGFMYFTSKSVEVVKKLNIVFETWVTGISYQHICIYSPSVLKLIMEYFYSIINGFKK